MPGDIFGTDRPLTVVVNPVAGGGRARRRADAVQRALAAAGVPLVVRTTTQRGDAQRFATAAPGAVLAVGGDGTVHEVLNGLPARDGRFGPLAVLPSGSGDDFAAAAGFAAEPDVLAQRLRTGAVRAVDCGEASFVTSTGERVERFVNDVGVGFEADVVRAIQGLPLRGKLLYLTATLRALWRQRPFDGELLVDGVTAPARPLLFATFCNVPAIGGGLPFAPDAQLDDGRLDLLEVAATSRLGTLSLLGKLVRKRHLADPRVRATRVATATVRCGRPVPLAMDGEFVAADVTSLAVRTMARALLLCGAG
ncbi:MAG: hypothetical protein H6835_02795 [Planctomycetes bacterium]|nr:hypothetical protein [Planctomycetota bacterium]